jgi:hypothetical protein
MRASPAYLAHRIERESDRSPDPHGYGDIVTTTVRYSVSPQQLPSDASTAVTFSSSRPPGGYW